MILLMCKCGKVRYMRKNLVKTKFAGIYYEQDPQTKVKTYIARIKINGIRERFCNN